MAAGSMFIMWLGEQITERGIGNGVSLLICINIVGDLPGALVRVFVTVPEPLLKITRRAPGWPAAGGW